MDRVADAVTGEPVPDANNFDPRSTPELWSATTERESPSTTIDRFSAASSRFRLGISDRLASRDDAHDRTVYGTAHWTVNVAHVLWDSWLHERDVLLPLGQPAPSSDAEERLVSLYGLFMALLPSMMIETPISATVQLSGISVRTIKVGYTAGSLSSTEVPADRAAIVGSTPCNSVQQLTLLQTICSTP